MSDIERYRDDRPDVDLPGLLPAKLYQPLSPDVLNEIPGAEPGGWRVPFEDGGDRIYSRKEGVSLIAIACAEKYYTWPADRGTGSAPIEVSDFAPIGMEWVELEGGRKACVDRQGNRVEHTLLVRAMVDDGRGAVFAFRSTAFKIGTQFARDLDRIRIEIDGEIVRVVGAKWRLTAELEKNARGQSWFSPRYGLIARYGEPGGPSLEEVRAAKALRFAHKLDEERVRRERLNATIDRPRAAGLIEGERPRGKTTIESGRPGAKRDLDDSIPW